MKCPTCQFENREGARFCRQCGIVLQPGPVEAPVLPPSAWSGEPPAAPIAEPEAPTVIAATPAAEPAASAGPDVPTLIAPIPLASEPMVPPVSTPTAGPAAPIPAPTPAPILVAPDEATVITPTPPAEPVAPPALVEPPVETRPEPQPQAQPFPRPLLHRNVGEVLDERYRIDQVLTLEPKPVPMNVYLATDVSAQARVVCRACGRPQNDPADEYCPNCGAQLFNRVLIREVEVGFPAWLSNPVVTALDLSYPGLMRHWRSFQEGDRLYMVSENPAGESLLDHLPRPTPESPALAWGLSLGHTLVYLHEHRVVGINLSPSNLMCSGLDIQIVSLAASQVALEAGSSAAIRQGDLTALGGVLDYMLTNPADPAVRPASDMQTVIEQAIHGGFASAGEVVVALEALIAARQFPPLTGLLVGQAADPGRVRERNEDSLLALTLTCLSGEFPQPAGLYVVADGMGGHEGGEIASGMAVRFVADFVMHRLLDLAGAPLDPEMLIREAIQGANQAVRQAAQERSTDMGTTVTAALVLGNRATIANVGDSRTYLVAGPGEIRRVTRDHSLVESLVAVGMIQPEEVYTHPQRNEVYRSVGDKPQVEVDTFVEPLRAGHTLLLCSDGLWEMIQDPFDIAALIYNAASPPAASEALVRAANEGGGEDNIAVIVVRAV